MRYEISYPGLAEMLGQDVPFWPNGLSDLDLMTSWQPGATPVTAPVEPELDVDVLLRMAAHYPDEHVTARALLELARTAFIRSINDTQMTLDLVGSHAERVRSRGQHPGITIAATPLPIPHLAGPTTLRSSPSSNAGWDG